VQQEHGPPARRVARDLFRAFDDTVAANLQPLVDVARQGSCRPATVPEERSEGDRNRDQ
jgi:hypothetical protein